MALARPPVSGATINSQSCEIAPPPSKSAGPMLRAGFTDVPVMGIHTICTRTSVSPMTRPASLPAPFFLSVAPSCHKNENKRKDGLSDKGLQHFPLNKAVAPCHGRAGMWPRRYQYEKYG